MVTAKSTLVSSYIMELLRGSERKIFDEVLRSWNHGSSHFSLILLVALKLLLSSDNNE
jgi:hypothetical protein